MNQNPERSSNPSGGVSPYRDPCRDSSGWLATGDGVTFPPSPVVFDGWTISETAELLLRLDAVRVTDARLSPDGLWAEASCHRDAWFWVLCRFPLPDRVAALTLRARREFGDAIRYAVAALRG